MQDVLLIDDVVQADVLMRSGRAELLRHLFEPRTCAQLAGQLGGTAQGVYYHVKALEGAKLARKVSEVQARGFREASYQATARSYWLSPRLVDLGGGAQRAREDSTRAYLLDLAEEMHIEVGQLGGRPEPTPVVGLSAQISLRDPSQRHAFLTELQEAARALATKYGGPASDATYRMIVACYPTEGGLPSA